MSRNKRRYPRIEVSLHVEALVSEPFEGSSRTVPAHIYQLGASGCALETTDREFEFGQGLYLRLTVPGSTTAVEATPTGGLYIRGAVVWAPLKGRVPNRYGIRFLWLRKAPGERMDDPVTEYLNDLLRPTGFGLMPRS
jgi:hypothetical protein